MAKSRAQRKAERRRRQQQQARQKQTPADQAQAQHDTQVPESADVLEAELAEHGVDLDELRERPEEGDGAPPEPAAPAPSRADVGAPEEAGLTRRERKRAERERRRRAKESEQRRRPKEEPTERRRRSGVFAFLRQVIAELSRVQWPDRPHLIQASAVTLVFIAILAAYLGGLDVVFNWFVQQLL
jgi:preprotein translocase subunit SecE